MVRTSEFLDLTEGDVFYRLGVRFVIDKIEHFTIRTNNYPYGDIGADVSRARVECHTISKRFQTTISRKVFMNLAPYDVQKITKKDKTRRVRPYTTRRNYPFTKAASRTNPNATDLERSETDDCTVRALSIASGVLYDTAHAHMERHGRARGKGCRASTAYRAAGFDYTLNHTNMNLGNLVKSGKLPNRCILAVDRHVCAVVNGTVIDGIEQGSRKRVYGWWHHRGPRPTISEFSTV